MVLSLLSLYARVILETSSGDAIEELPTITEYSKVKVTLVIDPC